MLDSRSHFCAALHDLTNHFMVAAICTGSQQAALVSMPACLLCKCATAMLSSWRQPYATVCFPCTISWTAETNPNLQWKSAGDACEYAVIAVLLDIWQHLNAVPAQFCGHCREASTCTSSQVLHVSLCQSYLQLMSLYLIGLVGLKTPGLYWNCIMGQV